MYHSTLCITVAKILKTVKLLYSSSVSLLKWILLLYSMCEVVKVCKFFFTTNLTNVDSMWSYSVVRRLFVCLFFPRWALWFFKNDKSKTWQANLRLISKFDTVEDFWAYVFVTCWVHATQYHRLKCKARIIVWMGFWFLFLFFWAKMLMIIPVCVGVFQWNSNWPIRWGEVACIHMLCSLY